ncbi:hypothetical protein Trco_000066 [Trichoderma cornu-damae]|uniref:Uncharacterized protein n=1 Tax=Trichoderma cornu-damae TaxID=654480 RepID=A0A9P8QPK6_9HYPO|nr:hypothetical protein Trco_000066 [Trichoderma cornu-damae]
MSSSSQQPPQDAEKEAPRTVAAATAATAAATPIAMPPAGYRPYVYTGGGPAFAPYPVPQQAFEAPKPEPNRGWEITKMAMQTLSIVLSVTGVGLAFSTLNYTYFSYIVVIGTAPSCIIALVWGLVEMIVRAVRKFKAGIHPGAHVALSLIISLAGIILTAIFGPWFQDSWNDNYDRGQGCVYKYDSLLGRYAYVCSSDERVMMRQFNRERSVAYAAAVITLIVAVIHFTLFVGACVDTSKANAYASRPIYIVSPAQGQQALMQGLQPIQQVLVQPPAPAPAHVPPTTHDMPPTEEESEDQSKGKGKGKGKGKEPMRGGDIVEHYAPSSGSQA